MNKDILQGKWEQLKGSIQKKWGKLTHDDVNQIAGDRKMLSGKIQERYGIIQDKADREIDDWLDNSK